MTAAALALVWAAAVGAGGLLFRPRSARGPEPATPATSVTAIRALAASLPCVALGAVLIRWPWAGVGLAVAALGVAATGKWREQRMLSERLGRELPEVIDLLRVCAAGGLSVRLSVECVAGIAPGLITGAFAAAVRAAAAGASLADALEEHAGTLGHTVRPLVSALAASERYGVAVAPSLERLATDARAEERRQGEARARKVPVRLLFPLVLCILPAFALLTVAPLIAGGLESLRLP